MPRYARPGVDEYGPFFAGYVAEVPEGDVLETLAAQGREAVALLAPLPRSTWHARYAEGKWSVAEVLGHLCDAERIFAYRALRFARGDTTPLAGFEENGYVPAGRFDDREPGGLLAEYQAVRAASLALFQHLPASAGEHRGTANGAEVSVRALVYIIAGHERHHLRVLRERYL